MNERSVAAAILRPVRLVQSGFYGDEPSLTDLDNGDLEATTDFRDIYQELLTRVVGTDPGPVLDPGRMRSDSSYSHLARWASRAESMMKMLRDWRRIQPRSVKSTRALFTVSRDEPTS